MQQYNQPNQPFFPSYTGAQYTGYTPTWRPQFGQAPAPTLPVNGVTKVNGRESAMQYQLPPNSTSPALFDQNGKTFYIVTTDGTGTKTVEAFDFAPHVDAPVTVDGAQFVSRAEFDEFAAKVNAVLEAQDGVHAAVPAEEPARQADGDASVATPRGHRRSGSKPRTKQS